MAIQKDTISINLAKGVNTKTDDKISNPDQASIITDGRFDKDFRIVKRNGMTQQGTAFQGDPGFINPVAFGTGTMPSKTFAHENQLCVVNNGNLFSQFEGQNKWIFKGTYVPVQITSKKIDANITLTDVVTVAGVTVAIGGQTIYAIEEATGNVIKKTALSGSETTMRAVAFSNAAWILTSGTGNLVGRQVSLSTGSVGSPVTLYAGFNGTGGTTGTVWVTVTSSSSTIGEAAFVLAGTTFFPFSPAGSVISSLGSGTFSGALLPINIYIEPSVNPNKLYLANSVNVSAYTFGTSSYSLVYSTAYTPAASGTVSANGYGSNNITMALSPIDNSTLYVFVDNYAITNVTDISGSAISSYNTTFSDDDYISMMTVNSAGTMTANSIYGYGYLIGGQCIRDTIRKTIYLPATYQSPTQASTLLMDMLEGQSGTSTYVIGKCLYGLAGTPTIGFLPQTQQTGTANSVYRTTNNGYFVDFNFAPTYAASSQYFAKTTHLTGGFLWAYDGVTLAEHNFLIGSENLFLGIQSLPVSGTVVIQGDAGNRETTKFTFGAGMSFQGSASNPNFTFTDVKNSGSRTTYTVNYTVDGVGPSPSGTQPINVALFSTDTPDDVAYRTSLAIIASSAVVSAYQYIHPGQLQFRNSNVGTAADFAVSGTPAGGNLSTGAYGYTFCYKWKDRNGQIYRSLPAVPQTANATTSNAGNVIVWAPKITNKTGTVSVEIYRTQANGSLYQLLTTQTMSGTISRIAYFDGLPDGSISSNAELYDTGGILDNFNIGACSAVSYFKERLMVNYSDDPLAVYYSKSNVVGEPVNFANELNFRVDADQNGVAAIAPMDDKAVIFKRPYIYVMSGDGANDLGEGSSLSAPLLIAGDVGTQNPNSVVLYPNGLMFKSDKGIYELTRGLGVQYVGAPVESNNSGTVAGAVLMPNITEIRFPLQNTFQTLVYNYFFKRWDYFSTIGSGTASAQVNSCCIWQNTIAYVTNSGIVSTENSNYYDTIVSGGTASYSMYYESAWLRLKGVQDFQRIMQLLFLGEWLTPHTVAVSLYYNFDQTNADSFTFNATAQPTGAYQFRVFPRLQKCESIKIVITETPGTGSQASLILNQLDAVVGLKRGSFKVPAVKTAT